MSAGTATTPSHAAKALGGPVAMQREQREQGISSWWRIEGERELQRLSGRLLLWMMNAELELR